MDGEGSERWLINIFGGKDKDSKDKGAVSNAQFAKTHLLAQEEFRSTIKKSNIRQQPDADAV
jgi:hypothetical protein